MLLAVSLFSSCKDDENIFVPEGLQTLVDSDLPYSIGGNNFNMVYVPEAVVQAERDVARDSLKLVVNPSYYIMQTEVTQSLYLCIMRSNPSQEGYIGSNLPVNYVNLYQCDAFAKALTSAMNIVNKNQRFRLPTPKEWLIAARGGNLSSTTEYSGSDDIGSVAWYAGNSDGHIHTVGLKAPNQLGLYDMSGNVSEWVNDSRVDIASAPASAKGSTYGGACSYQASECSISGKSTSLTSSTSTANATHSAIGMRLVQTAAVDTLLRLSDFDNAANAYKWKIVPVIRGKNVVFNVYDNLATGSTDPKYTISLNLVSDKSASYWELFPSQHYILYANELNKDIEGTVKDVVNNVTYRIKSGVMAIYSRSGGQESVINMNGMSLVSDDGKVHALVGARKVEIAGDFDLSNVTKIDPVLDLSDISGRTCIFKARLSDGGEATVTAKLTDSAPMSTWNFFLSNTTLTLGTDVTISATIGDDGFAEFTSGKLEILKDIKISLDATGVYNNAIYSVTTLNKEGVALNINKEDFSQITSVVATVTPDKPYECTVDFGPYGKLIMTLMNPSATWQFPSVGYKNYEMSLRGDGASTDNFISEAKFISADGTVGIINAGTISFGQNTLYPNLEGWINGKLIQMEGSFNLTVEQ